MVMARNGVSYPIRSEDQSDKGWRAAIQRAKRESRKIADDVKRSFVAGGFTTAAAGGLTLGVAIRVESGFQQGIADLSAITGAAADDIAFLREEARRLGATTTLSATQVAESFTIIGSRRPELLQDAAALSSVTEQVIALAEAAGTDLPAAARTAITAMNQFNLTNADTQRVVDALAAAQQAGAGDVEFLGEAIKQAGTAAESAGISFEETVAAIEVLAKAGLDAGTAGVTLRNIFTRLRTQMDGRFAPSVRGLRGVLDDLADAQLNVTDQVRLFETRGLGAAQVLINQRDRFSELVEVQGRVGSAAEQAGTRVDSLQGDLKALQSASEELAIAIGEKLNPSLRAATQSATDFLLGLTGNGQSGAVADRVSEIVDEINRLENASGRNRSSSRRGRIEALREELDTLGTREGQIALLRGEIERVEAVLAGQTGRSGRNANRSQLAGELVDLREELSDLAGPFLPTLDFSEFERAYAQAKLVFEEFQRNAEVAAKAAEVAHKESVEEFIKQERRRFDEVQRAFRDEQARREQLIQSLETEAEAQARVERELQDEIKALRQLGVLSAEEAADLRVRANRRATDEIVEDAERGTLSVESAFQDLTTSVLSEWIRGNRSIRDVFERTLADLAAQIVESQLASLFGQIFPGAGGLLSSLGGAPGGTIPVNPGNPGGNLGGVIFGGGRQSGGPVSAGTAGERRPEIFVPSTSGKILPDARAVGGNTYNNITNNYDLRGSSDSGAQVMQAAELGTRRALETIRQTERRS